MIDSSNKNTNEVKSILVVRSAPIHRVFDVLKKLREEYSNAEISMLVQEEVKGEIEKSGLVDKVIVGIKKGKISLCRHLPLVFRLRRKIYDLVAIIYNTEDINWYHNIRLFASLIKAKQRLGITTMNTFKPFSIKEEIFNKNLILRPLSFVVIVIPLILIFTIFLILVIFFYHLKVILERFKELVFKTTKGRLR